MSNPLYEETVLVERKVSAIAGLGTETTTLSELRNGPISILAAFANDDNIQQITVVSTNIGFVREYRKIFCTEMTPEQLIEECEQKR